MYNESENVQHTWNLGLPHVNGRYRNRIMCWEKKFSEINYHFILLETTFKIMFTLICLFIVMQKRVMKYMTRIGQNTGMLKTWKKVQQKAIT